MAHLAEAVAIAACFLRASSTAVTARRGSGRRLDRRRVRLPAAIRRLELLRKARHVGAVARVRCEVVRFLVAAEVLPIVALVIVQLNCDLSNGRGPERHQCLAIPRVPSFVKLSAF